MISSCLLAILAEIHDGGRCMRLHSRSREIVHHGHETWQYPGVFAGLELGAKIGAHLAERLACAPPDLRILVLQPLQWLTQSAAAEMDCFLREPRLRETCCAHR